MDYLAPPMFDISNIDMWKLRMSMYLKILGMHVFLATTKKSYLGNNKHIEANAQALEALRCTLNKEYLCMVLKELSVSSQSQGSKREKLSQAIFPPWWKPALALLQALWLFFLVLLLISDLEPELPILPVGGWW